METSAFCVFVARTVFGEVARITAKNVVGVELIGFAAEAADRLQPVDELRVGLRASSLQLRDRRLLGRQLLERSNHECMEISERDARRCSRGDLKQTGNLTGMLVRDHIGRDSSFVYQQFVQA